MIDIKVVIQEFKKYCEEHEGSPLAERYKVAIPILEKEAVYTPSTNSLVIGIGRCKCGAEFLDKETFYCGNCGQKLDWRE